MNTIHFNEPELNKHSRIFLSERRKISTKHKIYGLQQPFNMDVLLKPELGDYSPKTPGGNSTTDEISIW